MNVPQRNPKAKEKAQHVGHVDCLDIHGGSAHRQHPHSRQEHPKDGRRKEKENQAPKEEAKPHMK